MLVVRLRRRVWCWESTRGEIQDLGFEVHGQEAGIGALLGPSVFESHATAKLALVRVRSSSSTTTTSTMATADLSSLLTASKGLTSHLSRPDLPSVKLSLDQIEALSRRLVSRQPGSSADAEKACVYPRPMLVPCLSEVQQLPPRPSPCRRIVPLPVHRPPQPRYHLLAPPASPRHRRRWIPPRGTRTEPHFHHRREQEGNPGRLLQDTGGALTTRLGDKEKARLRGVGRQEPQHRQRRRRGAQRQHGLESKHAGQECLGRTSPLALSPPQNEPNHSMHARHSRASTAPPSP